MRALRLCSLLVFSLLGALACQSHTDAGDRSTAASTADATTPTPTPKVPAAETKPEVAASDGAASEGVADAACTKDSECESGKVCVSCGKKSECAPGCHTDDQCPKGERCVQVQCIRCPCPGQCYGGAK